MDASSLGVYMCLYEDVRGSLILVLVVIIKRVRHIMEIRTSQPRVMGCSGVNNLVITTVINSMRKYLVSNNSR